MPRRLCFDKRLLFGKSSCVDSKPSKPNSQQLFSIPEVTTVRSISSTKDSSLAKFSLWVYIIAGAFLGLVVVTGVTLW